MKIWKKMKKHYAIILIVCLAFLIRMLYFKQNFFFGFEQGRDFLEVRRILDGNLTLIGPKTDIDGIFHGAFSYYVLLLPFLLFRGNPYLVQVLFIILNSISVFFLYFFVKDLFNKNTALITAFLYALSYSAVIYTRWLSNPTLVPFITILSLFTLMQVKKNPYYLIAVAVFWSLIFHLEALAAIVLIPGIILYVIFQKIELKPKIILLILISCFLIFLPYIIFNIRHENILVKGIINYVLIKKNDTNIGLKYLGEYANEIVDGFYPISRIVAFALFSLFATVIVFAKGLRRNKELQIILAFMFFAPLFYILIRVIPLRHFFIIIPIFLSMFAAWSINTLIKSKFALLGITVVFIILIGNVLTYKDRLPKSIANFIYHAQHMYLSDQIRLLEFIYNDAKGSQFSYEYFSIPYWKNEAWEYLFLWYGKDKFGYLPSKDKTKTYYVLIEPDESQPLYQKNWYDEMNKTSKVLEEFDSGYLKVEKRMLNN